MRTTPRRHVAAGCTLGLILVVAPSATRAAPAGDGRRLARAGEPGLAGRNRDQVLRPTFRAELRGGVVAAGCGLRGSGPPEGVGTITIAGIPPGATVVRAILNWTIMGEAWPQPEATIEPPGGPPVTVTGTPLGEDWSPCWVLPFIYGFSADVCAAMTADGNGTYTVRLPDSGDLTTHPSAEGAALIVVYEHPAAPPRDVVVYEGLETQDDGTSTQTVEGFDAAAARIDFAEATFVVSDGQGDPIDETAARALVDGFEVIGPYFDGDEAARCTATDPRYFDVDTVGLTTILRPGARSLAATVESGPEPAIDCVAWSAFVLSVATDTASGLPASCLRPCPKLAVAVAGPDVSICAGQTTRLDGAGSGGCGGLPPSFRWLAGATVVCDWSPVPTCDVAPSASETYRLEVSCQGDRGCAAGDEVSVFVEPDTLPPDLGNTLRAVRVDTNALFNWGSQPLALSYALHRGESKGVWPPVPLAAGLPLAAAVDVDAVLWPPRLYFYRVAGQSCSGREGP